MKSTLKRIPWWGWGLIVSAAVTAQSAANHPDLATLDTIVLGFILAAVVYVPIAGLIAWASRRFGRSGSSTS